LGAQEDASKRKEFQRRTDDDIDSFLSRSEFKKSAQTAPEKVPEKTTSTAAKVQTAEAKPDQAEEPDQEEQIRAARTSRAEIEAYQDIADLRKKAHKFGHKAAKLFHKYKALDAKAHKCTAKAAAFREKSDGRKQKASEFREREKTFESELSGAATGKTELSPEAIRSKMADLERKAAKQEEVARKNESKAAAQTAKASKFKTRSAKFLEDSRYFESESKRYAKRADNLEKAGA
jgi:hypothetical protein